MLKPERTRIIYFPIMNPSGYERVSRHSYPNGLDLNRDYPIDNNTNCYLGSATHIIDSIYRNYSIDLTVNLHNGADELGWNWGTFTHRSNPKTVD